MQKILEIERDIPHSMYRLFPQKILDIVARWPGSVHDQTIFNHSNLSRRLLEGNFGTSLIVADSGYANTHHVITPFVNTPLEAHQLYNESVIRIRNPVERSYGVWKRRFTVLKHGMHLKLETCQAVYYCDCCFTQYCH